MCVCVYFRLTVQASEAEHPDLLSDVIPGPWCAQSFQLTFQLIPHQQDPICHGLHVILPSEWWEDGGIANRVAHRRKEADTGQEIN